MLQFRFPQLPDLTSWMSTGISLPRTQVYDIEELPERRARTLKHLIKANHINHSIVYHQLQFHNHAPHMLGAAYIFGADSNQLNELYDTESRSLEPWKDSPGEISIDDWRTYLGKPKYQRAWIDFFEDQLVKHGYDWRSLLNEFLLQGKDPLINNLICGLAHPLIHLGYAYELSSREIAIESLGLAACFYNDWHKYLDDPQYTRPSKQPNDSLFIILDRVSRDPTFDKLVSRPGHDNIDKLLANQEASAAILEHWNAWSVTNSRDQFAESQKLAVALLVATPAKHSPHYDFFLCHLLTSSHAVRVLLPLLPAKWHINLVRQWWLFTLLVYIAQLRPNINVDTIKLVELEGRDWKYVTQQALTAKHSTDAHYVKSLRSMHEASKTWGDPNDFYLKAAVKFAQDFSGWTGWG